MKLNLFFLTLIVFWIWLVAINLAHADFPRNDLSFPVDSPRASKVSKSSVDTAIKLIRDAYSAEAKKRLGCTLKIVNAWKSPEVNAYASRDGNVCYVEFLGGFARHPKMTYAAVMNVLCHEVGHHLGGQPIYDDTDWASCEGQSDYWAQSCMKRILGSTAALAAGLVLGEVIAGFNGEPVPRYETPDRSRAYDLFCSHPAAQCRVDTYFAGIHNLKRPVCWYNPGGANAL